MCEAMNKKILCRIPNKAEPYEIEIQDGLLNQKLHFLSSLASRFAIITDDNIAPLYAEKIKQTISNLGKDAYIFSFPAGETSKTRATKEALENQLFEKGLGRDTCVIALGGGVVTDLAGYLAATYCRGVPLVMIPTTLLGMVDASIGGKTGVNVPYGKNMVGCIYQPKKVLIDPSTLKSLPFKERISGFVEMIKHGLVVDDAYFNYLEEHASDILELKGSFFEKALFDSCRIKVDIIEQDEKETGKRHLLNFGHTLGHALENLTHYSLTHGEAVAIGILVESYLSLQLGGLDQADFDRIKNMLERYKVPMHLTHHFSVTELLDTMVLDKKSLKGKPRFVILEAIGSAKTYGSTYCTTIEEPLLKHALEWMNDALCRH